jgi:hydroxyacylglutathione hydrolase
MRLFEDVYVYPWVSFQENNCNSIFLDGSLPVLFDPGHSHLLPHLVEGMAADGIPISKVRMIVCTHSHPDHIEGLERFDDDVLRAISSDEYLYLQGEGKDLYLGMGCQVPRKPFSLFLKEGMVRFGAKTLRVIPTPGHSPGSICLYWEEKRLLISGDTLFYMGVGRTDLPGGNPEALGSSVELLSRLNIECLVPGHGEIVKGSAAVKRNIELVVGEFFSSAAIFP